MDPQLLTRQVTTTVGRATAALVDTWIGVTTVGDLLIRDVWEVTIDEQDLQLRARVLTFPDPTPEQLAAAINTDVTAALLEH